MKKIILIVLVSLASPSAAQAWTNCYMRYDDGDKQQEECLRQNELDAPADEVDRQRQETEMFARLDADIHQKRLEEFKRGLEYQRRQAQDDAMAEAVITAEDAASRARILGQPRN